MFCNKCGAQLPEGVRFCNKCGASLAGRAQGADLTDAPLPSASAVTSEAADVSLPNRPKRKRARIVIGIAAALLVVAVVVAGIFTNWFGFAGKGVWRVTKVYENDQLVEEWEFDGFGRVTSGKRDISQAGKSYTAIVISYDDSLPNRYTETTKYEEYKDGKVTDSEWVLEVQRYEFGPDGRILSERYWNVPSADNKGEEPSEDHVGTCTFSYGSSGELVSIDRTDPKDGSFSWTNKRSEFGPDGYLTKNIANSADAAEKSYAVRYSASGRPEAVVVGDKRYEAEGDENGNITSLSVDGTTYRYECQFFDNPKAWDSPRSNYCLNNL